MDIIMKKLVIGIVAHVDAGKTTLSEGILYTTGTIRKVGRVDNRDAFLDTYELERARGITIFSKQAEFVLGDIHVTLLDTPGHVDFSAEMERTLQVLDYAVLVVSGADGVQGHTRTLWRLLKQYKIPVFIFVNKMDQKGVKRDVILEELKNNLDSNCVNFNKEYIENFTEEFYENTAVCDEALLEEYMENGNISLDSMRQKISERKIIPCYFGSALKLEGVDGLLQGIEQYALTKEQEAGAFGAKVFKIARDESGERLTYIKVTSGVLKARDNIHGSTNGEDWQEKVNQIRVYSGEKYKPVNEIGAGSVCAVTGLTRTNSGQGLGIEKESDMPLLEPVLTYQIVLPDGCDAAAMMPRLRQLEEEIPELHIAWNEKLQEIQAQIMGEVQIEILKSLIAERFNVEVEFGSGHIVYKETIADTVEGVGHFEPLRHYAEVHLLIEPAERGSGITIEADCSEDVLNKNWQRLIVTHLHEKEHRGVLIGAPITDVKITLVTGRAHLKHTEGGDFRQATYRAVRQGLKKAQSVLLEPYYNYVLELPVGCVGRAMTDMEQMMGSCELEQVDSETSIIRGEVPVATLRDYQKDVIAYTKGHGKLSCTLKGYGACHNQDEIVANAAYDSERDLINPTGSVFCAHGAGFTVPWDEVEKYMHLESIFLQKNDDNKTINPAAAARTVSGEWLGVDEVDEILRQTFGANKKDKDGTGWKSKRRMSGRKLQEFMPTVKATSVRKPVEKRDDYLLVDGYNVIFAWKELSELAAVNIDGARGRLLDIMCNYQGIRKCNLIVVFDAYRVKGHPTECMDYHNIHVVYTKEAETADQYIERFAHDNGRKYNVTVATSDGLEQIIITGQGCSLISSREFEKEVTRVEQQLRTDYLDNQKSHKTFIGEALNVQELDKLHMEERKKQ